MAGGKYQIISHKSGYAVTASFRIALLLIAGIFAKTKSTKDTIANTLQKEIINDRQSRGAEKNNANYFSVRYYLSNILLCQKTIYYKHLREYL
jgi:hypothetical protein